MSMYPVKDPVLSDWNRILYHGRHSATYKFALAEALLLLAKQNARHISLEELAAPYAQALCRHIREYDRQGTASSSVFLDACRDFCTKKITTETLIKQTVKYGFNNVLKAFHIVDRQPTQTVFFSCNSHVADGIFLEDAIYELIARYSHTSLIQDIEICWHTLEVQWMRTKTLS